MTHYVFGLVVAAAFSCTVAVSAFMVRQHRTTGWLVGVAAQLCLAGVAIVTRTWTLLIGPIVVGPVFVGNWIAWRRVDRTPSSDADVDHRDDVELLQLKVDSLWLHYSTLVSLMTKEQLLEFDQLLVKHRVPDGKDEDVNA